jgi:hypothetical protein
MQLDGIKLCRNCGAENPSGYTFCKRCGFFVGTLDQRRALVNSQPKPALPPANLAPGAMGSAPAPVTVKRDNEAIITARRVGDPGKGIQRVETPKKPTEEEVQATTGSWLVAAIIVFMAVAALLLVLMGGGR